MKKLTLRSAGLSLKLPHFSQNFSQNQQGFIPMMLCIIGVIALIIFLVYSRVAHVNN